MDFLFIIGSYFILLVVYFALKRFLSDQRGPKGPWGLPFLGHVFFLGKNPPRTFLELKKKYGPVFQIYLLHKRYTSSCGNVSRGSAAVKWHRDHFQTIALVLNDRQSITECFAKSETSGRSCYKLIDWGVSRSGLGFGFTGGLPAEEQRQFFLQSFRKHGIGKNKMEEILCSEASHLISSWRSLSGEYFNLSGSCAQYVLNSVWRTVASKRYSYKEAVAILRDIEILADADSWLAKLTFIAPWLVNKFSRDVEYRLEAYERLTATQRELADEHKETRLPNKPRDIMDMYLDKVEETTDHSSTFHPSQNGIAMAFRDVLIGTIETTSLTLEWFILYVTKHPKVYAKLGDELQRIIGSNRSPTLADKENMPYMTACILETLRKSSVVPLSLPHSALADMQFRDFHIPKGTLIFGNLYAFHHDPDTWETPERFYPERFLTPEGALVKDARNKILPFGTGKRYCIGSSIVEDEMFLLLANLYQEFTIEFETQPQNLDGAFGLTNRPPDGLRITAIPKHQC